MRFNKYIVLPLTFFVSLALYYVGVYLGDLVGIGGYDGEAPESLYNEFQFGKFSNSFIYSLTEAIALICLTLGPAGLIASLLYSFYMLIKTIFGKLNNLL